MPKYRRKRPEQRQDPGRAKAKGNTRPGPVTSSQDPDPPLPEGGHVDFDFLILLRSGSKLDFLILMFIFLVTILFQS